MAKITESDLPTLEDQHSRYQEVNSGLMNWLDNKGTLVVAKKFFANWLFVAGGGELELYSDEVSSQDLAQQLAHNSNYFLSVEKERGRGDKFLTWYHLCFDNNVFIKEVTVGNVSSSPKVIKDNPFYYRGFDAFDLGYVKEAAAVLEALRESEVPNLSPYLDGVEASASRPETA